MKTKLLLMTALIISSLFCFAQSGTTQGTAIDLGTFTGQIISVNGSNISGFNNCFTGLRNQTSPDVFYRFTITSGLGVEINTLNTTSGFDTFLHLAIEESSTQYSVIEDNDDFGGLSTSKIVRYLFPGTYLIIVEGYTNNTGNYNLEISRKPGVNLSINKPNFRGEKIINGSMVVPDTVTFNNPKYLSFKITNSAFDVFSGNIEYQVFMSDDNQLNILIDELFTSGTITNTNFLPATSIFVSYDFSSRYTKSQIMNKFFFIIIDPNNKIAETNETDNNKELSTIPGYYFNNPIQLGNLIKGQEYSIVVNNSPGNGFYNHGNQQSADVFVEFTLAEDANVSFTLCNSKISDSYLTLWESYYTRTNIGYNDDYCKLQSFYSKNLTAQNSIYHVQLEGYNSNNGEITLEVSVSGLKSGEENSVVLNADEIDDSKIEKLSVTPNPAQNSITISGVEIDESSVIEIISMNGKITKRFVGTTNTNVDISDLENGMYYILVTNNVNSESTKLIIKK